MRKRKTITIQIDKVLQFSMCNKPSGRDNISYECDTDHPKRNQELFVFAMTR